MDPNLLVASNGRTFRDYLASLRGRDLAIASAFGIGETELLESLVRRNRHTTFYVGTQNCFTRPDFIAEGKRIAGAEPSGLRFVVDFRRDESIHYKLALVAPSTVVIGSANFTSKGLGLSCDLMAVLDDRKLYAAIMSELSAVDGNPGVFATTDEAFTEVFRRYKKAAAKHAPFALIECAARSSSNPFAANRVRVPTLAEWLASEAALPLMAFAYLRGLNSKEQSAANRVKAAGDLAPGLFPYAPERKPFEGVFLDIDGSCLKPRVHVARSCFYGRSGQQWIMFGKHLPSKAVGFRMSAHEASRLAAYALKTPGLRTLSVPEMRQALET